MTDHKKHACTWDFMPEFLWKDLTPTKKMWRQQERQKCIGTGLSPPFCFFFIVLMLIFFSVSEKEKMGPLSMLPYLWYPWGNHMHRIHLESDHLTTIRADSPMENSVDLGWNIQDSYLSYRTQTHWVSLHLTPKPIVHICFCYSNAKNTLSRRMNIIKDMRTMAGVY